MDCQVTVEAAIWVYNVDAADEALRIAIAKTGERLNPDLSSVEITPESRTSSSGEPLAPVFLAADTALVAVVALAGCLGGFGLGGSSDDPTTTTTAAPTSTAPAQTPTSTTTETTTEATTTSPPRPPQPHRRRRRPRQRRHRKRPRRRQRRE